MARRKPVPADPAHTPRAAELYAAAVARLAPPEELQLSAWMESNIRLPEGQSARPGPYRNWPYLREIIDSIGDLEVPRVSVQKPTRVGFTKGLVGAIGATAATDPCPMILLVPTDSDTRDYAVDEIEPVFSASPGIAQLMLSGRIDGRNTMVRKSFIGGASLKILAARAARNLRKHDAKKLYVDEADAMELTKEGDALALAERRTMAHADRKIVVGSTPTDEDTSVIARRIEESDRRIFEVPCPHCAALFEIKWANIRWPSGRPREAYCVCPHCEQHAAERGGRPPPIFEAQKLEMVTAGVWRATRPEVTEHRGYVFNALISLLANAAWGILAEEFLRAKRGGPAEMQVFVNTVLAETWKTTINATTADILAERAEDFGIERGVIPAEVLMITAGADVQDDRIEVTLLGWPLGDAAPLVLGHFVLAGNTLDDAVWQALDRFRRQRWMHPNGWAIGIDGLAVDSGGREGRTQKVYDWTRPRLVSRVFAIKGDDGPKPIWKRAAKVKGGYPLFIVGTHTVKTTVMERMGAPAEIDVNGAPARNPHAMRFSADLEYEWFQQATNETRRIRYVRNRAVIEFVPKRAGAPHEALDCLCYAWAVRTSPPLRAINLVERAARRPDVERKPMTAADWSGIFNG